MFKKIQNAFNKGIKNADEDDKNQTALAFIASDHFPIIESAKVNLTKYNKIPLSEIAPDYTIDNVLIREYIKKSSYPDSVKKIEKDFSLI